MTPRTARKTALLFGTLLATAAPVFAQDAPKPAPEMQAVLDKLAALGSKPFSTLTVPEARSRRARPTPPAPSSGTSAYHPIPKRR